MSSASKKRGGIGEFWDTVAPPVEDVRPPAPEPAPPPAPVSKEVPAEAGTPTQERPPGRSSPRAPSPAAPARPRGRPPTGVPKERVTVNLSPRSLQILESLRYQARMSGQRSATFSELLDEAVALLAKHYKLQLKD